MKYLEINEQMEKILNAMCDVCLKSEGIKAHGWVNLLINNIKEKMPENPKIEETESTE